MRDVSLKEGLARTASKDVQESSATQGVIVSPLTRQTPLWLRSKHFLQEDQPWQRASRAIARG